MFPSNRLRIAFALTACASLGVAAFVRLRAPSARVLSIAVSLVPEALPRASAGKTLDTRAPPLPPETATPVLTDPRRAPPCAFGAVTMTVVREDPSRSFATILDLAGDAELAEVGHRMADHQLRRVTWDRVFFRKGDDRCQMRLGEDDHVKKKRVVPSAPPKRAARRPPRRPARQASRR